MYVQPAAIGCDDYDAQHPFGRTPSSAVIDRLIELFEG